MQSRFDMSFPSDDLLFVYGTLKRGLPNHLYLARARFLGAYRTAERYPLLLHGQWLLPVLIDRPGVGHCVGGELFGVDAGLLAQLDRLEGVDWDGGYRRRQIRVVPRRRHGEPLLAQAYLRAAADIDVAGSPLLREYR